MRTARQAHIRFGSRVAFARRRVHLHSVRRAGCNCLPGLSDWMHPARPQSPPTWGQFMSFCYERTSTIASRNEPFLGDVRLLGNNMAATAPIGRLVQHARNPRPQEARAEARAARTSTPPSRRGHKHPSQQHRHRAHRLGGICSVALRELRRKPPLNVRAALNSRPRERSTCRSVFTEEGAFLPLGSHPD